MTEFVPPVRYRDPGGEIGEIATVSAAIHFVRTRAASEAPVPSRRVTWEGVWSSLEDAQDSGSPEQLAVGRDCLVRKLASEHMLVYALPPRLAHIIR